MLFPASVQPVVDASANVRVRDVDVISVYIDMQPIPFNRGYYSIDLTFFFDVSLELYGGATVGCERVSGISIFNKKVILYGSEGNVKMFTSESCRDEADLQGNKVLPKATVQVAQPVALSAKLCEHCRCGCGHADGGYGIQHSHDFLFTAAVCQHAPCQRAQQHRHKGQRCDTAVQCGGIGPAQKIQRQRKPQCGIAEQRDDLADGYLIKGGIHGDVLPCYDRFCTYIPTDGLYVG